MTGPARPGLAAEQASDNVEAVSHRGRIGHGLAGRGAGGRWRGRLVFQHLCGAEATFKA